LFGTADDNKALSEAMIIEIVYGCTLGLRVGFSAHGDVIARMPGCGIYEVLPKDVKCSSGLCVDNRTVL